VSEPNMDIAKYPKRGGGFVEIPYDKNAPCRACGQPVTEASMGGTDLCPWCDMGKPRPGSRCPTCGGVAP
jgi:hypothetical protein